VDAGSFGDELHLVVPPYSAYLRAVRLVAADAAARAGLDCEETDDFRLAVNELCEMMLSETDHSVFLSFTSVEGSVVARGTTRARGGSNAELTSISASILGTLSDYYTVDVLDGELVFVVARGGARARR
jgi:hypothetical protein